MRNTLENVHKSAWHGSWYRVSTHSIAAVIIFPSFLSSLPPSLHPVCPPSSMVTADLVQSPREAPALSPLSTSPLALCPRNFANHLSPNTHISVLPGIFSVAFTFLLTRALVYGQIGREECKCYHFGPSSGGAEHRCLQGQAQPGKNGGIVCGLTQRLGGPTRLPTS